jgi:hypothetical protein
MSWGGIFVPRLAELEESPYPTNLLTPCFVSFFVVWVSRYIKNYFRGFFVENVFASTTQLFHAEYSNESVRCIQYSPVRNAQSEISVNYMSYVLCLNTLLRNMKSPLVPAYIIFYFRVIPNDRWKARLRGCSDDRAVFVGPVVDYRDNTTWRSLAKWLQADTKMRYWHNWID